MGGEVVHGWGRDKIEREIRIAIVEWSWSPVASVMMVRTGHGVRGWQLDWQACRAEALMRGGRFQVFIFFN